MTAFISQIELAPQSGEVYAGSSRQVGGEEAKRYSLYPQEERENCQESPQGVAGGKLLDIYATSTSTKGSFKVYRYMYVLQQVESFPFSFSATKTFQWYPFLSLPGRAEDSA